MPSSFDAAPPAQQEQEQSTAQREPLSHLLPLCQQLTDAAAAGDMQGVWEALARIIAAMPAPLPALPPAVPPPEPEAQLDSPACPLQAAATPFGSPQALQPSTPPEPMASAQVQQPAQLAAAEAAAQPDDDLTAELINAAELGDEDGVAAALAAGADPNAALAGSECKPLHAACYYGHLACVQRLLAARADPSAQATCSGSTRTPMECAVLGGDCPTLVAALLAAGTDLHPGDSYAAHLACSRGRSACLALLLEAGTDPNAECCYRSTLLHEACRFGQSAVVAKLLAAGAGPAAVDCLGRTPLHLAADCHFTGGAAAVRLLLAAAPQTALARNANGQTPLDMALRRGSFQPAQVLLEDAPLPRASEVLRALQAARLIASRLNRELPPALYTALVSRQPLTPAECARIPAPCPGMDALLPAVLCRSEAEALALAHHLPAAQCARLRAAALCLKLWERRQGATLPPDVTCLLLQAALE